MKWTKAIVKSVHQNSQNSKKQKQFGYLLVLVLVVYLGISFYKKGIIFDTKQTVALGLLLVCILIIIIHKKLFYPILFLWLLIGEILGKITSTIVLSIIYFLLFTPISLLLNSINKKKYYKPQWFDKNNKIDYENLS